MQFFSSLCFDSCVIILLDKNEIKVAMSWTKSGLELQLIWTKHGIEQKKWAKALVKKFKKLRITELNVR